MIEEIEYWLLIGGFLGLIFFAMLGFAWVVIFIAELIA